MIEDIDLEIKQLKRYLDAIGSSKPLTFQQVSSISANGVYLVYKKGKIIYVGSSTTTGHKRLKDLSSHWSNHTLHCKLLKEKLNIKEIVWCKKGQCLQNSKETLIGKGIFNEEKFNEADNAVIKEITSELNFKFIDLSDKAPKEIKRIEHFIISVLNPQFND